MDEDEVEMMEETEGHHTPAAPEQAEGERDAETEDEQFRCKHYKRKCQFVVSLNWFVYKRTPKKIVLKWVGFLNDERQFDLRMVQNILSVAWSEKDQYWIYFWIYREMRKSLHA